MEDEYYQSYGDVQVHALMLKDRARVEAYRKAIEGQADLFQNKTVLDVGAGTGILSLFCARAGAAKVFAVEASEVNGLMKEIVKGNGYDEVVEVLVGEVEKIKLPAKVDIIVSEWMGFYLLHESMLDSVVYARDKWLKSGGLMFPDRATLYSSFAYSPRLWEKHFTWANDFCGMNFSPLGEAISAQYSKSPLIDTLETSECQIVDPVVVKSFDLCTLSVQDLKTISTQICFKPAVSSDVQFLALWFDVAFPCAVLQPERGSVNLSTAPSADETHWKQSLIALPQSLPVVPGMEITFDVSLSQADNNARRYEITFDVVGVTGAD